MTKKIFILTFFFLIGIFACDICSEKKLHFKINDIQLLNQRYSMETDGLKTQNLGAFSEITIDDFAMLVDLQIAYISQIAKGSFMPTAYADECYPGQQGIKDPLIGLSIVAETDYNVNFKKNDVVNDMIQYNYQGMSSGWSNIIFNNNEGPFIYENSPLVFRLRQAPTDRSIPHRFSIHFVFQSGNRMSAMSENIHFLD